MLRLHLFVHNTGKTLASLWPCARRILRDWMEKVSTVLYRWCLSAVLDEGPRATVSPLERAASCATIMDKKRTQSMVISKKTMTIWRWSGFEIEGEILPRWINEHFIQASLSYLTIILLFIRNSQYQTPVLLLAVKLISSNSALPGELRTKQDHSTSDTSIRSVIT